MALATCKTQYKGCGLLWLFITTQVKQSSNSSALFCPKHAAFTPVQSSDEDHVEETVGNTFEECYAKVEAHWLMSSHHTDCLDKQD